MKKTVLSIRSTRLCISRIIRLGKFAILGSFFEAVYGKAALYRGKFFGKAKKEERRVRTENTEGTECTLGTPIFRLAWLLDDKKDGFARRVRRKDENIESMPD